MTYRSVFLALCAAFPLSLMHASASAPHSRQSTRDVAEPIKQDDVRIEFVDESSERWNSVRFMSVSEMLEAYKIIVCMIGHEQDLQQVLHQESSEIKLLIACVRQVNAYMESQDCPEDDWMLWYTHNATLATRLFLLSHYGIVKLSADDEKVLYESVKNNTEDELLRILIMNPPFSEYCYKSDRMINKTYYFPASWEKQMRDLTISKWASWLKCRIQLVFSQNG